MSELMSGEERKAIVIYLNKDIRELLRQRAREKGMTLSSYVRLLIINDLTEEAEAKKTGKKSLKERLEEERQKRLLEKTKELLRMLRNKEITPEELAQNLEIIYPKGEQ